MLVIEECGMEKLFVVVPYCDKDEAKSLGARWDAGVKSWYIDLEKIDPDSFAKWIPAEQLRENLYHHYIC